MTDSAKINPPDNGGVIHIARHGYTLCAIFLGDVSPADRWVPEEEKGSGSCPYCLAGKPAPLCSTNPHTLRMWTVYAKPRDYPDSYVVRAWRVAGTGAESGKVVVIAPTLDACRRALDVHLRLAGRGGLDMLHRMPRQGDDDSVIVETWV